MDSTSNPTPEGPVDDRELVALAQAGDAAAMSVLLTRHYDYVHALCRRVLRNPHDAEDAGQEALISATRYIATFSGRSSFRTWLHAIARNVCLNMIRANARLPNRSVDDLAGHDEPANAPGTIRDANSVADRLNIDAALAGLPKNLHDAVVLRFVLDMDYAQIADVLGVPLGTVKTWLRRGRIELQSALGETPQGARGV